MNRVAGRVTRSAKAKLGHVWSEMWSGDDNGACFKNSKKHEAPPLVPLPPLISIIRPFIFIMQMVGLFHMNQDGIKSKSGLRLIFCLYQKIVSFLLTVFMWLTVAYNLYSFDFEDFQFDHSTLTRIGYLCWFIQNALAVALYFYSSCRSALFKKLFLQWDDLAFPKPAVIDITRYCKRLQWFMIFVVFGGSIIVTFVIMEVFVIRIDLQEVFDEADINSKQTNVLIYGVMGVINGIVWVNSLAFFLLICVIMRRLFIASAQNVRHAVKYGDPNQINIEEHRRCHQSICDLTVTVDRIFSELIFSYLLAYLLILCLVAYEIVGMPANVDMMLIRGFWCSIGVGTIVFVCSAGASINAKAHQPYLYLNRYSLKYLPSPQDVQILMFAVKLTGPNISLTAWGMCSLTQEIMLTMASAFMTYVLLLVQLQSILTKDVPKSFSELYNDTSRNFSGVV